MLETYDKLKMEFMIPIVEESVFLIIYIFSSITWHNRSMVAKLFIKLFNSILNNKSPKSLDYQSQITIS